MSASTAPNSSTTETSSSSSPSDANFTEKLAKLRRQQEEQYFKLTQQYKEQQDVLKQQQQQELKQYYQRQMILNPNHKIPPPTKEMLAQSNYRSYHMEAPRKHELGPEDKNISMLEGSTAPPNSSNALSALVRDRVRKKALDNINKKSAFEHIDAQALTTHRQDEFNRWVYESRPYGNDEDGPYILRKATSEPNLKGRNTLKHRVRYKPCVDHHPLMPTNNHPRHSYSPGDSRHPDMTSERREAISPPYKRDAIEGKVFHKGPRGGVPPLFQSPSLPNINLGSGRSQVHFPTSMSLGTYSTGSTPDLKAPLHPGHPKYLDMLKTQYATNHRYLQHIMLEHRHDPKDIDLFHQRYLSKTDDHRLSDEERVKQLLESQNRLYLHLVDLFKLSPPYTGLSKSFSKLHSIENVPPPSSLIQSRSHDSLHSIKSPPQKDVYYKDDYLLQPHGLHTQSRFRFNRDPYPVGNDLHMQDHQAARLRLKEHLRDKHEASSSTMKSMSLDSHFRRLERDHKIQEETPEDVEKEERKHISPGPIEEETFIYRTSELANKRSGESASHSSMYGSGSRLNNIANKLHGSASRLYGSNPSLHGSDHRLHNSNPHLYNSDQRIHRSNPRLHGSDTRIHTSDPRLHGSDSRLHGSESRIVSSTYTTSENESSLKSTKDMTGLVYDTIMLKHQCTCGGSYPLHPECSGRLQSIWARLQETGVANICERIRPRKATLAELQTVHSEQHALLFGGGRSRDGAQNLRCFSTLACGGIGVDADTIWNDTHTSNAARMAAGCVIELAFKVASGDLKNGFAIVRPPGHHAEAHQAMGFCYFNSIAIAAKLLRLKMAVERVLILDWDIHHGNGTQQMFYDDDRVLYMSMHRHDDGTFFPGTGKPEECGAGIGVGCNINIPFCGGLEPTYGDKEYLAAFRTIVLPVVKEYKPDIILVSAGFDAADGHSPQLGGYTVTAACYAYMTKQLMEFANGKLVLALEGGYALQSLCDAAENCVRTLQGGPAAELSEETKQTKPHDNAVKSLEKVIDIQAKYWPSIKRLAAQVGSSLNGAKKMEKEEADTVNALASLSMQVVQNGSSEKPTKPTEREEPMDEN